MHKYLSGRQLLCPICAAVQSHKHRCVWSPAKMFTATRVWLNVPQTTCTAPKPREKEPRLLHLVNIVRRVLVHYFREAHFQLSIKFSLLFWYKFSVENNFIDYKQTLFHMGYKCMHRLYITISGMIQNYTNCIGNVNNQWFLLCSAF